MLGFTRISETSKHSENPPVLCQIRSLLDVPFNPTYGLPQLIAKIVKYFGKKIKECLYLTKP